MTGQQGITDLPELVAALPSVERRRFEGIFHVTSSVGALRPPVAMHGWIRENLGPLESVLEQRVVRVTNLVTMEGALFNGLRSRRPLVTQRGEVLRDLAEDSGCAFCRPLQGTPEDVFGRVQGAHSVTASNIAKFDGLHGVVIFRDHDPLTFSEETVADYIDTAMAWAERARAANEEAKYPFFLWNCLWRAGASIVHGHAQVILGRDIHYAKVEHLRRAARGYGEVTGTNYFDDLYRIHDGLGLAMESSGTRILVYLAPVKEKEVFLISGALDRSLEKCLYQVLDCFVRFLGVESFNVVIYMPPLGAVQEDWSGFPVLVRILDRGDLLNRTADMGAMELYASSIISSDPFRVAEVLRQWLEQ